MQGINWGSLTFRAVISRCFPAVLSRHTQPIIRIVSAAVCSSFISALRFSSSLLTFLYPPLLLFCPPPLQQREANEHWEAVFGTSVNLMAAKGGQTPSDVRSVFEIDSQRNEAEETAGRSRSVHFLSFCPLWHLHSTWLPAHLSLLWPFFLINLRSLLSPPLS